MHFTFLLGSVSQPHPPCSVSFRASWATFTGHISVIQENANHRQSEILHRYSSYSQATVCTHPYWCRTVYISNLGTVPNYYCPTRIIHLSTASLSNVHCYLLRWEFWERTKFDFWRVHIILWFIVFLNSENWDVTIFEFLKKKGGLVNWPYMHCIRRSQKALHQQSQVLTEYSTLNFFCKWNQNHRSFWIRSTQVLLNHPCQ